MPSPIDEHGGLIASALAAISGGIILWWRSWMRVRSDLRTDRANERAEKSADFVDETYRSIIERLVQRVEVLHKAIDELNKDFAEERAARILAEDLHRVCEHERRIQSDRIAALEEKLK
jgi:hypothetical protein